MDTSASPGTALDTPKFTHQQLNRETRGYDFYPGAAELARIPRIGHNKSDLDTVVVHLHYHTIGQQHWYVAELNPTGHAFGYVDLNLGLGEWGNFDLAELEAIHLPAKELRIIQPGLVEVRPEIIVYRDLDFVPGPAAKYISVDTV